jgi:crotonobetainyl-CoA:carnitine CoA-transferase CaiB-like acyl-CoA transferase
MHESPSSVSGTANTGPLAGVRVIELGVWVAAPAAAGLREPR